MKLTVNNISKFFGSDLLFENVTFNIEDNDKIGLVGVNGAGKTTLFNILNKGEIYDSGDVYCPKNIIIGYMQQNESVNENNTIMLEILGVFNELMELEKKIDDIALDIELSNGNIEELVLQQHKLTEEFEQKGGFMYKSRARAVLLGLGFCEEEFNLPMKVQSGGQETRLLLGKMLLGNSDLLLLDEPTNHLDINSVEWLEEFLINYSGALIIISHDRYFLDRVTNRIFELQNKKLTVYNGNYSTYLKQKEEMEKAKEKVFENTMQEINRLEGIIEQQKRWNREKNIKTAESKQKVIDKLEKTLEAPASTPEEIEFQFRINKTGGNDVLIAEDIRKSFEHKNLLNNIDIHIRRGERIFLLGPNGCGKTTLFKILLSMCECDSGNVKFGSNIDVGYYDQLQENIDSDKTILDEIWDQYPKINQKDIRNACAAFLFKAEDVLKKISVLSGGEKARVALLKLMLSGSNFLMMDEPTNHLDIYSREALEQSFLNYKGTMFIISHDRYFINKLADKIYRLTENGIKIYNGGYDYYVQKYKEERTVNFNREKEKDKVNDYRAQKEKTAFLRKFQNSLAKIEKEIEDIEGNISDLNKKLVSPDIVADYQQTLEIVEKIDILKTELALAYENWDSISSQLEEAQK